MIFDTCGINIDVLYFPCKDAVEHIFLTQNEIIENKYNIIKWTDDLIFLQMNQAIQVYPKIILLPETEYLEETKKYHNHQKSKFFSMIALRNELEVQKWFILGEWHDN